MEQKKTFITKPLGIGLPACVCCLFLLALALVCGVIFLVNRGKE